MIVAGEASGDLHAARLLSALASRWPGPLHSFGLGGPELAASGCETVATYAEISVVGLLEVLRVYRRAKVIFNRLLAEAEQRRPDLAILVDFPEFNLRLAKQLAKRGIPVVYYISPQVWAWRRGRVRTVAKSVDTMLVLFPFELDFYREFGVRAVHVGHPLVDEVPTLPQAWEAGPPERYRLLLLPGSRRSEVAALVGPMLGAVAQIAAQLPLEVRLLRAPNIAEETFTTALSAMPVPVTVVSTNRFEEMSRAHLALCASGTATLEVGLVGTPMLVLYRLGWLTHLMARLMVRLPYFSLVNLVLGRKVVPELLQGETAPERLAAQALALLRDPAAVAAQRSSLAELRTRLGAAGASERAAEAVAQRLREVLV